MEGGCGRGVCERAGGSVVVCRGRGGISVGMWDGGGEEKAGESEMMEYVLRRKGEKKVLKRWVNSIAYMHISPHDFKVNL